ncbi:MAG: hypothetical protein CMJ49_13595 [Planctomycetaceae bacterium]|nr:hypothetical protein [Planctomycetaceae bacterium]
MLEEHVATLREAYEQFRVDAAETIQSVQRLRDKSGEIVAEMNRIVGATPDEAELATQSDMLDRFLAKGERLLDTERITRVFLVTQTTIKDHLRAGGSLPGFTYSKATDTVSYHFSIQNQLAEDAEITVPVGDPDSIRTFFPMLTRLTASACHVAFHEIAEYVIFSRLRPSDPYFRWFSDGFANAIAGRLISKHMGAKAGRDFAAMHDVAPHADLRRHVNLYYWMGVDYCIETPLEKDGRLTLARYAYATSEADRLIDAHGLECVRLILDQVDTGGAFEDSRRLFPAVMEVTGEDMEQRFKRYQLFDTKAACIEYYAEQSNAAVKRRDYAESLYATQRMLELKGPEDPRFYSNSAWVLFRMGHEDMGDRAILDHADFCKRRGNRTAEAIMHKLFIDYALHCRNLAKAVPSAQEVLADEPEHVPAMAVEMLRVGEAGNTELAHMTARRILELEPDPKSPWRQLAQSGFAAKSNE